MPGWESIRGCELNATNVASGSSAAPRLERCDPTDRRGCTPAFAAQAFAAISVFGAVGALAAGGSGSVDSRPGGNTFPGDGGGIGIF